MGLHPHPSTSPTVASIFLLQTIPEEMLQESKSPRHPSGTIARCFAVNTAPLLPTRECEADSASDSRKTVRSIDRLTCPQGLPRNAWAGRPDLASTCLSNPKEFSHGLLTRLFLIFLLFIPFSHSLLFITGPVCSRFFQQEFRCYSFGPGVRTDAAL